MYRFKVILSAALWLSQIAPLVHAVAMSPADVVDSTAPEEPATQQEMWGEVGGVDVAMTFMIQTSPDEFQCFLVNYEVLRDNWVDGETVNEEIVRLRGVPELAFPEGTLQVSYSTPFDVYAQMHQGENLSCGSFTLVAGVFTNPAGGEVSVVGNLVDMSVSSTPDAGPTATDAFAIFQLIVFPDDEAEAIDLVDMIASSQPQGVAAGGAQGTAVAESTRVPRAEGVPAYPGGGESSGAPARTSHCANNSSLCRGAALDDFNAASYTCLAGGTAAAVTCFVACNVNLLCQVICQAVVVGGEGLCLAAAGSKLKGAAKRCEIAFNTCCYNCDCCEPY